jgi:hypothetical protein
MGRINKILSFIRTLKFGANNVSDVTLDSGGGPNITAQHFSGAGDDSYPLTSDYAVSVSVQGTGVEASVGYVDPINPPSAQAGERRMYSRDPNTRAPVAQVWLKNDGEILVSNDNGSVKVRPDGGSIITTPLGTFDAAADGSIKGQNPNGQYELQAGGTFVVNNVTISPSGAIVSPVSVSSPSVVASGKELAGHDHNILGGSSAPGPTGSNN